MTRRVYDDGDGRYDTEVICNDCGTSTWDPEPDEGWAHMNDEYDEDSIDQCPKCAKSAEVKP